MTRPSPEPEKDFVQNLASPDPAASYGELLTLLSDRGVRPPRKSERTNLTRQASPPKPGTKWTRKELSLAIGLKSAEGKQIWRYCNDEPPPPDKHAALIAAIFGSDPHDYLEWRAALQDAWEREKNAGTTVVDSPQSDVQPVKLPASTIPLPIYRARSPLHFFGREAELDHIDSILATGMPVALTGPHGIGKTALAAAYADRRRERFTTVAWIDAETPAGCIAGLAALSRQAAWSSAMSSSEDHALVALNQLANNGARYLLIYDNAVDPAAVQPFLPVGAARVIITSNYAHWQSLAEPVPVAAISDKDATDFLLARRPLEKSRPLARSLAIELGGYPIALELAAAYCERRDISFDHYLKEARLKPAAQLLDTPLKVPGYPRSIQTSFNLSIEAAAGEHPAAITALRILCAFGPEYFDRDLVADIVAHAPVSAHTPVNESQFHAALAVLKAYSLIQEISVPDFSRWRRRIRVHRLVAIVVTDFAGSYDHLLQAFSDACERLFPYNPIEYSGLCDHLDQVEPQAIYLLNRDRSAPTLEVSRLHGRLAKYYASLFRKKEALHHAKLSYRLARMLSDANSIPYANALVALACAFSATRKTKRAIILLRGADRIACTHLPEWHGDVVCIRFLIAEVQRRSGHYQNAMATLQNIAAHREQTWPGKHSARAALLLHLCFYYEAPFDADAVLAELAEVLVMLLWTIDPRAYPYENLRRTFRRLFGDRSNILDVLDRFGDICRRLADGKEHQAPMLGRLPLELILIYNAVGQSEAGHARLESALAAFSSPSTALMVAYDNLAQQADREFKPAYLACALAQAAELGDLEEICERLNVLHSLLISLGDTERATRLRDVFGDLIDPVLDDL